MFIKKILRRPWFFIRIAAVFVFFFCSTGFIYLKVTHQLSPGPLSTVNRGNPLGGVASHAELHTQCSHCHAPIHCLSDTRCQDCHIDIARDRKDSTTLHGRIPGVSHCQTCHPEHNGATADLTVLALKNIDHYMLADFSIVSHAQNYDGSDMTCSSCHIRDGSLVKQVDCITCHSDEDHDYLASHIEEYGNACVECHDGKDRMVKGFDHEPYFALQGGHQDQSCSTCHTQQLYVGIDATCFACHEEPEVHLAEFGTDCARCHTDLAWAPAELISHPFALKHADEPIGECEECHTDTYTQYTCVSCHKDPDMQSVHASLNTPDLQFCAQCHPTGLAGEVPLRQLQELSTAAQDSSSLDQTDGAPGENLPTPGGEASQNSQPNQDTSNKSGKDH